MVGARAGGSSLERAVLEGFWEEVTFQPGLDGDMQLSRQDLGEERSGGGNREGKGG